MPCRRTPTTVLSTTEVRVRIQSFVPAFLFTDATTRLNATMNATIAAHPALELDYVNITIQYATNSTIVAYVNTTDDSGINNLEWDTSTAAAGAYNVSTKTAYDGKATILKSFVNVTKPSSGVYDLKTWRTYGHLAVTSDHALYRITHPSSCADWFEITVEATPLNNGGDSKDIDFHLTQGDPLDVGTDSADYDVNEDGTESKHTYKEEDLSGSRTYSLLVETKDDDVEYEVTYARSCGGGGPPEPPGGGGNLELPVA